MSVQDKDSDHNRVGRPYRLRLPGFVSDEDLGLGDALKNVPSYFGAQACGGCERRRVALNGWMTLSKGRLSE